MATWTYLSKYGPNNPPTVKLYRTDEMENKYMEHLSELKKNNIQTHDYIMKTAFPNREPYSLLPNTFPYDLQKGILHWLLWVSPNVDLELDTIKRIIYDKFGSNCVFFRNISTNQSIKSISHYHIFICKD